MSRPWRNRQPRLAKIKIGGRWRRPPRPPRETPDRPSPAMVMLAAGMRAAAMHDARDGITPSNIIALPSGPEYLPPGGQDPARYRQPKDSPATVMMKGAYTAALNTDARERGVPVPYPSILEPVLQALADERRAVERRRA